MSWELLPTLSKKDRIVCTRDQGWLLLQIKKKPMKLIQFEVLDRACVAIDVPQHGKMFRKKCKSTLLRHHTSKLQQVHKVCPEWTRVVLWLTIFSVVWRFEGHFFITQDVSKSSMLPRPGGSVFQQGGTTLLFLMHCQIQLELTFWAWLPSSGLASVCVADAAS